jgi:signal recognition particle receptor subunit beta
MAVFDAPSGIVTLKVVYYGPPAAGKTTNLERISPLLGNESTRLTPRLVGENRIVSLETPAGSLGRLMGMSVVVRLQTIQGEVPSAVGWSEMLADADGIVFVADSSPHARSDNVKALAGIRERLDGRGRSAAAIPVVMQWNKRDHDDARPIAELEMELNHRCFPSIVAATSRGTGVTETLIEILKRTIVAAHRMAGTAAPNEAELEQTLTATIQTLSHSAREASNKRYGVTIERQPPALQEVPESPRAERMLIALEGAASAFHDESVSGLPRGLMAGLLAGSDRSHGSLLLFRPGTQRMEESELVPAGGDPLNAAQLASGGMTAATLCSGHEPRFIGDLAGEVFLDSIVPGTEHLQAALIVPLVFGSLTFGGMVVYVTDGERAPTAAEQAYWKTAATFTSMYLARQAAKNPAIVSRRTGRRPSVTAADTSAS